MHKGYLESRQDVLDNLFVCEEGRLRVKHQLRLS